MVEQIQEINDEQTHPKLDQGHGALDQLLGGRSAYQVFGRIPEVSAFDMGGNGERVHQRFSKLVQEYYGSQEPIVHKGLLPMLVAKFKVSVLGQEPQVKVVPGLTSSDPVLIAHARADLENMKEGFETIQEALSDADEYLKRLSAQTSSQLALYGTLEKQILDARQSRESLLQYLSDDSLTTDQRVVAQEKVREVDAYLALASVKFDVIANTVVQYSTEIEYWKQELECKHQVAGRLQVSASKLEAVVSGAEVRVRLGEPFKALVTMHGNMTALERMLHSYVERTHALNAQLGQGVAELSSKSSANAGFSQEHITGMKETNDRIHSAYEEEMESVHQKVSALMYKR